MVLALVRAAIIYGLVDGVLQVAAVAIITLRALEQVLFRKVYRVDAVAKGFSL